MNGRRQPRWSPLAAFLLVAGGLIVINVAAIILLLPSGLKNGVAFAIGCAMGIVLTLCLLGVIRRLPRSGDSLRSARSGRDSPPYFSGATHGARESQAPQVPTPRTSSEQAIGGGPEWMRRGFPVRNPSASATSGFATDLDRRSRGASADTEQSPPPAQPTDTRATSASPPLREGQLLSDVAAASRAIQEDVQQVARCLAELRREASLSYRQDPLPALQAQHQETMSILKQTDKQMADLRLSLDTKLEQLLAYERRSLLLEAEKVATALDQRINAAHQAIGSQSAILLETLMGFKETYSGVGFALLDKGVSRIVRNLASKPEFGASWDAAQQLAEMRSLQSELRLLIQELTEGQAALVDAAARLSALGTRYHQLETALLPTMADALTNSLRSCFLEEIEAEYLAFMQNRTQYKSQEVLSGLLKKLGLELTVLRLGESVPDPKLHEIVSSTSDARWPSGTVANVLSMGYQDVLNGQLVKAKVLVNRS